jgi:toxin ParE1/3/4
VRALAKTTTAARDTREIVDYLLDRSEPAADRFTAALESVLRLVRGQPRMGRARDDLARGLRSVLVAPYLVFYRFTDDEVQVLRILRGSRDITPGLFAGTP